MMARGFVAQFGEPIIAARGDNEVPVRVTYGLQPVWGIRGNVSLGSRDFLCADRLVRARVACVVRGLRC